MKSPLFDDSDENLEPLDNCDQVPRSIEFVQGTEFENQLVTFSSLSEQPLVETSPKKPVVAPKAQKAAPVAFGSHLPK